MNWTKDFRRAFGALDPRALIILWASLLLALIAAYMLVSSKVEERGEVRTASRVYEPVDSIARFRDERQRMREAAFKEIEALISDDSAGQAIKDKARERALKLSEWMEQEVTIEGILRAQGYEDPLVTVHADSVNVLIRKASLTQSDAAKILSLAARETGQTGGNIKVIPVP